MKSLSKANAYVRQLKDVLSLRFAGSATIDTVRETKDSNGWPMLIASDGGVETAGNPVIAIRISSANSISPDVFGTALVAFNPHLLEIAFEADSTGIEPSQAEVATVSWETMKLGMKTQLKIIADGTAVTATSMTATAATAELDDLYFPGKGV